MAVDIKSVDCTTGKETTRAFTVAERTDRDQIAVQAAQDRQTADTAAWNRSTLAQDLRNALATNRTYMGLATPNAAQTTAEVKALAAAQNKLIRLVAGLLDATD